MINYDILVTLGAEESALALLTDLGNGLQFP